MGTTATTNTTKNICISCDAFDELVDASATYAGDLSTVLSPGIELIFSAFVGVLVVWRGIEISMSKIPPQQIFHDLWHIALASGILFGLGGGDGTIGLIATAYKAGISTMAQASAVAFTLATPDVKVSIIDESGLSTLLRATEAAIMQVFSVANNLWDKGGFMGGITALFMGFLLTLTWAAVIFSYMGQLVVALFRMTLLAILSPFLVMSYGFNWSRGMTMMGIKTFLGTIIVLFTATAALGLCVFLAGKTALDINYDEIHFFDPVYLKLLFIGLIGAALMTEGVSLANSITGTSLTNTAAGVIAGGGLALTAAAKAKTLGIAKVAGGAIAGKAGSAVAAGVGYGVGAGVGAALGTSGVQSAKEAVKQKFYNAKNTGLMGDATKSAQEDIRNYKNSNFHQGGVKGADKAAQTAKNVGNKSKSTMERINRA